MLPAGGGGGKVTLKEGRDWQGLPRGCQKTLIFGGGKQRGRWKR